MAEFVELRNTDYRKTLLSASAPPGTSTPVNTGNIGRRLATGNNNSSDGNMTNRPSNKDFQRINQEEKAADLVEAPQQFYSCPEGKYWFLQSFTFLFFPAWTFSEFISHIYISNLLSQILGLLWLPISLYLAIWHCGPII